MSLNFIAVLLPAALGTAMSVTAMLLAQNSKEHAEEGHNKSFGSEDFGQDHFSRLEHQIKELSDALNRKIAAEKEIEGT